MTIISATGNQCLGYLKSFIFLHSLNPMGSLFRQMRLKCSHCLCVSDLFSWQASPTWGLESIWCHSLKINLLYLKINTFMYLWTSYIYMMTYDSMSPLLLPSPFQMPPCIPPILCPFSIVHIYLSYCIYILYIYIYTYIIVRPSTAARSIYHGS